MFVGARAKVKAAPGRVVWPYNIRTQLSWDVEHFRHMVNQIRIAEKELKLYEPGSRDAVELQDEIKLIPGKLGWPERENMTPFYREKARQETGAVGIEAPGPAT